MHGTGQGITRSAVCADVMQVHDGMRGRWGHALYYARLARNRKRGGVHTGIGQGVLNGVHGVKQGAGISASRIVYMKLEEKLQRWCYPAQCQARLFVQGAGQCAGSSVVCDDCAQKEGGGAEMVLPCFVPGTTG